MTDMDWAGLFTRVAPGACAALTLLAATDAAAERVVFINLDSVAINADSNQDPTLNSYSSNGFTPGTASGFMLSPEEESLLHFYLKEATTPFDVEFVFDRPAAGPYDMVVFGSDTDAEALFADNDCPNAIGLADCGDGSGHNISFVFQGCLPAAQQSDMRRIAYYALTGLGFGWGLENESSIGQIMGTYSVFGLQFGDECAAIVDGTCGTHPGCTDGSQNATADLNIIIGARVDDGPPSVTITEPLDGSTVDPSFSVAADVVDGFGGLSVRLTGEIAGMNLDQERAEPPYTWDLNGVPAGTWTLNVEVTDADLGMQSSSVTINVAGEGGESTSGGDDSTGGDPTDDTSDPSGTPTTGDATIDPTVGSDTGDSEGMGEDDSGGTAPIDPTTPVSPEAFGVGGTGCQCTAGGSTGGMGWTGLALLGLMGLRVSGRRRAGRTSTRPSRTSNHRDRTSR